MLECTKILNAIYNSLRVAQDEFRSIGDIKSALVIQSIRAAILQAKIEVCLKAAQPAEAGPGKED